MIDDAQGVQRACYKMLNYKPYTGYLTADR